MTPAAVLVSYLKAYGSKDLASIDGMLADDVCLQDWNISVQGRMAFLEETKKNFRGAEVIAITVLRVYEGDGCAAAQLRIVLDGKQELEIVDAIVTREDGKIASVRAYKG